MIYSGTTTKRHAHCAQDREFARQLARGEEAMIRLCEANGVSWNILRPTMIYCLGRDRNLTQICRFIRLLRFFPLVGTGDALRQPVHACDLAEACVRLLEADPTCLNRAYNLSGAEVISYREMVTRLFIRERLTPRFLPVPLLALRLSLNLLRLFPRYRYLTPDMADRMEMDMVFSHHEASEAFGYRPRAFNLDRF